MRMNLFTTIRETVQQILDSEAVVRERRRRIRESIEKRRRWDRRLRNKSPEELDVIASLENLRDTRTLEDIADQNWQHARTQTFALYLIVQQLDELLGIMRANREGANNADALSDVDEREVGLGGNGGDLSPPAKTGAPARIVDDLLVCTDLECDGACGLYWWDGSRDNTPFRWQRVAQHDINRGRVRGSAQPTGFIRLSDADAGRGT